MDEKIKALIGLVISVGGMLIAIFLGYAEQYPVAMWVLGGLGGLAISKIAKF